MCPIAQIVDTSDGTLDPSGARQLRESGSVYPDALQTDELHYFTALFGATPETQPDERTTCLSQIQ